MGTRRDGTRLSLNDTPTSAITYLIVVSRDSVRMREKRTDDCGVKRFKYLRV
jgi:hypothetical protein